MKKLFYVNKSFSLENQLYVCYLVLLTVDSDGDILHHYINNNGTMEYDFRAYQLVDFVMWDL